MGIDFEYLAERLQCSYNDKLECLSTVATIIDIANMARKEGIFNLEKEIKVMKEKYSPLLVKGISIVIYGIERKSLEELMYNYILAGDYKGKEFLKNIIIAESVIEINEGINPSLLQHLIFSYFGETFIKSIELTLGANYNENYTSHLLTKEEIEKLLKEAGGHH